MKLEQTRLASLVVVEWRDAVGHNKWLDRAEMIEFCETGFTKKCYTAGFLLKETKDYLIVAQSISGTVCDHVMLIPRGMITKVEKCKLNSRN